MALKLSGNEVVSSVCSDCDLALWFVFRPTGRKRLGRLHVDTGTLWGREARERETSFHTVTLTTAAVRPRQWRRGGHLESCVDEQMNLVTV